MMQIAMTLHCERDCRDTARGHKWMASCTASICLLQSVLIKDPLGALTSLHISNACEVTDDKAQLQSLPSLRVAFDTLNKAYHGQWWHQLKQLRTKCPCNVALGGAGHFPEGLEVLSLHTLSPEPVTVSTNMVTNQPRAHVHQVGQQLHKSTLPPITILS